MPKKRKLDAEEKDDTLNSDDVEVKTEQLSQEDVKGSPPPAEENGKRAAGRNLRPRKSTCYAEKDSPEVEFEEKVKKIPRRKRRPTLSEDGSEEKEPKIKRNDKDSEESVTPSKVPLPSNELGDTALPPPTLVSSSTLSADDGLTNEGENSNSSTAVPASEEGDHLPKVNEKKRPKKKPKVKPDPTVELSIDANVVPKAEPVSPSAAATTENKEKKEETEESKKEEQLAIPPKPKKKRIRKKPALPPVCKIEGQSEESKSTEGGEPTIKEEAGEGENRTADGEKGKEGEDATKPAAAPRKRPPKKKAKPEVKPDPESHEEKAAPKDSSSSDPPKEGDENKEIKSSEDGEKPVVAATVPRKRVKNRPKKPVTDKTTEIEAGNKPGEPKEGEEKQQEGEEAKKTSDTVNVNEAAGPAPPPPAAAALIRRPFFRGRRSKSISARSGRKEIIYTDEVIDPEDIKGFEHVEKYVAPVGVKLPKFWDSEDEMSEDENNDNFRRIMCGFGTNCRIHEVIRPASEIVRRLKELQNTFGATKSLPLFRKQEKSESNENSLVVDSTEPFFRKDRPIVWHTDPSFFKYANNYPSKCK